jgi:ParB family chromosome partitioning protein
MKIPINKILVNPEQPRVDFDAAELESLAESIRQNGLLNPICVTVDENHPAQGEQYILIDGERRWRAHQLAGIPEIEAQVINLNGHNRGLLAVMANLQRTDLNPVEIARSIRKLNDEYSQASIGEMFGKSQAWLTYHLAILDLEVEIQELYAARLLPLDPGVIFAIRNLPDDLRVRVARRFAALKSAKKAILTACKRYMEGYRPGRKKLTRQPEKGADGRWDVTLAFGINVSETSKKRARQTCNACVLYEDASRSMCRECPLVMYLKLEQPG